MRKLRRHSLLCLVSLSKPFSVLLSIIQDWTRAPTWQKYESANADDIIATAAPAIKLERTPIVIRLINGASTRFQARRTVSGLLRASCVIPFVTIPTAGTLVLRCLLTILVRRNQMEGKESGIWVDNVDLGCLFVLKNAVGIRLANLYRFSITLLDDVYFVIILFHHSILT
jgi:hypothetical protein